MAVSVSTAITSISPTTAVITATPSGGTGPYTFIWYRSQTSGFTPSAANQLSTTTSVLTDTPPLQGTPYYYKCAATDSLSVTGSAPELPAVLTQGSDIILGFIGDSVTAVAQSGVPKTTAQYMADRLECLGGLRNVSISDQAVSGSRTDDWLPSVAINTNLYNQAKTAFIAASITHIIINLGTNDARVYSGNFGFGGVSYVVNTPQQFGTNLSAIITKLLTDFPNIPILLNSTAGFELNIGTPSNTEAGLQSAFQYASTMISLCDNSKVYAGDTTAILHFMNHPDEFFTGDSLGVHPGITGALTLSTLWAKKFCDHFLSQGSSLSNSIIRI